MNLEFLVRYHRKAAELSEIELAELANVIRGGVACLDSAQLFKRAEAESTKASRFSLRATACLFCEATSSRESDIVDVLWVVPDHAQPPEGASDAAFSPAAVAPGFSVPV